MNLDGTWSFSFLFFFSLIYTKHTNTLKFAVLTMFNCGKFNHKFGKRVSELKNTIFSCLLMSCLLFSFSFIVARWAFFLSFFYSTTKKNHIVVVLQIKMMLFFSLHQVNMCSVKLFFLLFRCFRAESHSIFFVSFFSVLLFFALIENKTLIKLFTLIQMGLWFYLFTRKRNEKKLVINSFNQNEWTSFI